ncbi:MAG: hypothetical protein EWV61_16220 [Microcystis aeruginosa Ma_AC_P_19900807_S300]|nr:MAG: hypothetical protein EWV61_16220 [Microcystis aeruginosa Ma_AC_P_19900807_S300]
MLNTFPYTIFLYLRHNECRPGKHSSVDVCHGFRNLVSPVCVGLVGLGGLLGREQWKLKVIKRRGYGFRNFKNFSLRCLLNWHFAS